MRKSELVILFSTAILILSACGKKSVFGHVEVLGHGGNGLEIVNAFYHDNSLESIELALLTDGCDGVELDVRLSADGTLWLYHDNELDDGTNGTGCVETSTDEYLSTLHYSSVDQEALIRLSDIPKSYLAEKKVYIDGRSSISCTNGTADMNTFVNEMVAFQNVCLASTEIIVETRNDQWEVAVAAAGFTTIKFITHFDQYADVLMNLPTVDIIVVTNETISKHNISQIHDDGLEVIIFGMRSVKSTREAYNKNPDGILADNLRTAIIEKH
ncbi:MAG: glycerophosphodiester phosphodiesterase family protein [Crocinitomicaceae bacterium]|nr:glycerophosphodiester phosphodiesterase family protein [Crocinitomicaceae bacterium]